MYVYYVNAKRNASLKKSSAGNKLCWKIVSAVKHFKEDYHDESKY